MATVYSLVCWGGLTGKTTSISASTDLVTLTNHGLRNGHKLWPSGPMPAELNSSTPVYARSTASNTFTLHPSQSDAVAGTNQILFAGSSSYSVSMTFDDQDAYHGYNIHPDHVAFVESRWVPEVVAFMEHDTEVMTF